MKKLFKSCLCVALVLTMLAGVFCVSASAEEYLEPGYRYSGTVYSYEPLLAPFIPSVSGRHFIESLGSEDTYVVLYDGNMRQLASDDDDGEGRNFRLCANLTANNLYYFEIRFYNQSTSGDITFDFHGPAHQLSSNTSYEHGIYLENAILWTQITPSTTTMFSFQSDPDTDTEITLYDSGMNQIGYDDNSGVNGAFRLNSVLRANQTYYCAMRFADSSTGTIEFAVADASYTMTTESDVLINEVPFQHNWMTFKPTRTTYHTFYSYDSTDPFVELYDSTGRLLATDDDGGDGLNFFLSRCLTAEKTYYVAIGNYGTDGNAYTGVYEEYYPDVSPEEWYYEAVNYATEHGFMTGYQNGMFGPADRLQRQDFVVSLVRIAGGDTTPFANSNGGFPDVATGSYYAPSVAFAANYGVVSGYQNGEFGVGDRITREQVCTILYRACGSPEVNNVDETLGAYPDDENISAFARIPMAWAIQNGMVSGMQDGSLSPISGASRAQIATILMRMDQNGMFGGDIVY